MSDDALNANPDQGASSESAGENLDPAEQFAALIERSANREAPPARQQEPAAATPSDEPASADKEEPAEKTYRVKVNGEEIEVPESELLQGYSRDKDYRVKTEKTAEERRTLAAERQAVMQERQQLYQAAQHFLANQQVVQEPPDELIDQDPMGYMREKRRYDKFVQDRETAIRAARHVEAQNKADHERQFGEYLQTQQEKLIDLVPDWKDEGKRKAESKELLQWMTKQAGYSAEEAGKIFDARAMVTLRKAMLYDRMQEQANAAQKRVQPLPPRMQRPGASETIRATDGRTNAMQALRRSGSTDAAAAVFEKLL